MATPDLGDDGQAHESLVYFRTTHERWLGSRSRQMETEGYSEDWYGQQCGACRFWLPLAGVFGGDYGACSNPSAEFSGSVGPDPRMRDQIRIFLRDGQNLPTKVDGHAGGMFPGMHAEIVAVNELLVKHDNDIDFGDIAVSSVWTAAAPAGRITGSAAHTCPNCTGILSDTSVTILTN